jgi:hypothetical protein
MFFVGGQYYTSSIDGLKYMSGQMYVEYRLASGQRGKRDQGSGDSLGFADGGARRVLL